MNIIFLILDSYRQDHMSLYHEGNGPFDDVKACKTPNLDRFAERCVIFENAYADGYPTMPVRMQLMTGQRTLPYRGWEPLRENDLAIQTLLRRQGYVCGMISDVWHYRAPGMNYHMDFDVYRWIRGQEYDPWKSSPTTRDIDDYVNENYTDDFRQMIAQFLGNTDEFSREEDWYPYKVVEDTCEWLKANRCHENIFLWFDCFDPHEPWDPPALWDTYTEPGYTGKRLIMPMGGMMSDWATDEEIRYMRGLYAGEAGFVDHCLGRLFDCLETEGYYEDSLIVLVSDHGHPLGDHGKFLKGVDRMYSELLKVPFLVHLPGSESAGLRSDALVYYHDVTPTVFDLMGQANNTESMHGKSFLPVLKGDTNEHRQAVITGFYKGEDRCIRDKRWSYILRPEGEYDELYDLKSDPRETKNVIDEYQDEAVRLCSHFGSYFLQHPVRAVKGIQGQYELGAAVLGGNLKERKTFHVRPKR